MSAPDRITGDASFWPRLVAAVDESLGLEEKRRADPDRFLASVQTPPLGDAEAARVVRRCLDRNGAARAPRARRRRALLPIGAVALLAAATVFAWRWHGRESMKTLEYTRAFDVLFDATYPAEARISAQVRIYEGMKRTLLALRELGHREGPIRAEAEQALGLARLLLAGEVKAAAAASAPATSASLEECLLELAGDAPSTPAVFEALRWFALGVLALRNTPNDDPQLVFTAGLSLAKLGNVIAGRPPKAVRQTSK